MQIDEALGAQAGIVLLLNNLGARSTEVSDFLNTAVEVEEMVYGGEGDVGVALMNASNLGTTIDFTINRLRVLVEKRTGQMLIAKRGKR